MELTKDSEYVLLTLYKGYKDKQSQGMNTREAKKFGSAKEIGQLYFPEININDLVDSVGELHRNDFISCTWASDTFVMLFLTDKTVYEMENKYKNNFKDLLDTLVKLRSLIF